MTVAGVGAIGLLTGHTPPPLIALAVAIGGAATSASVGTLHGAPLNIALSASVLADLAHAYATVAVPVEAVDTVLAWAVQLAPDWLLGVFGNLLALRCDRVLVTRVSERCFGLGVGDGLKVVVHGGSNGIATMGVGHGRDIGSGMLSRWLCTHRILHELGTVGLSKTWLADAFPILAIALVRAVVRASRENRFW